MRPAITHGVRSRRHDWYLLEEWIMKRVKGLLLALAAYAVLGWSAAPADACGPYGFCGSPYCAMRFRYGYPGFAGYGAFGPYGGLGYGGFGLGYGYGGVPYGVGYGASGYSAYSYSAYGYGSPGMYGPAFGYGGFGAGY